MYWKSASNTDSKPYDMEGLYLVIELLNINPKYIRSITGTCE